MLPPHRATSAVTHEKICCHLPLKYWPSGMSGGRAMKEARRKSSNTVVFLKKKKRPPSSHPVRDNRTLGPVGEGLQNSVLVTDDILTEETYVHNK